jgi:uncharacterized protein (TIGR02145 family)
VKCAPTIVGAQIALLAVCLAAQESRSTTTRPGVSTVTDIDGNVYKTVTIGNQVWMAEDLKTTRYRNGDLIGTTNPATLDISGESAPTYQWAYAGNERNVATYGRLYTWYASTDSRAIAPAGWHVPTDAEWTALVTFLGGESVAQGKLKEAGTTHWNGPNSDATNESGFTALPGGNRFGDKGFIGLGDFTHWWTSTEHDAKFAWRRVLGKDAPMGRTGGWADKKIGWLVRCVREAPASSAASLPAQESRQSAPTDNAPAVTYIANEGFLIEAAGKKVLVDALFDNGFGTYLSPPQEALAQMTGDREPFADVDLLLVTHPHGDHFNPKLVVEFLRSQARCRLIAHTQTVDQLRKEEGFAQIEGRIHEVKLAPGAREQVSHNGIALDVLCLKHMADDPAKESERNVAFVVELGGVRLLHLGDALVNQSEAYLRGYPFEQSPVDVLFLNQYDRSQTTQQFIARKIKPSQIVAMHVPPAGLAEETDKIHAVYPHAIVFRESMERRSVPIDVDFHELSGDYFGQPPPGATPQLFARGIVSMETNEHSAPSFAPDGNEVFWWANRNPEEGPFLSMTMQRENGRWSAPRVTPFGYMVAFAPDGRRAYFYAFTPRSASSPEGQSPLDIWVVEKQGDAWSEPKCLNLVARYPELREAALPSIARNGTLYFIGYAPDTHVNQGIYRAEFINGEYAKPELLPRSINLPPFHNWTPFIAPDESYLLFSSNRTGGLDRWGDLYISRRLAGGSWTEPVSLGEPVNTPWQEGFPGLSPDGKYLFFCRDTADRKNEVYWVDAATIPALRSVTTPSKAEPR